MTYLSAPLKDRIRTLGVGKFEMTSLKETNT